MVTNIAESKSHTISLEDVRKYFKNNHIIIDENKLEVLYNKIDNKNVRTNDLDKQWVACTDIFERETVLKALEKIIANNCIPKFSAFVDSKKAISISIDETCKEYKNINLTHKARIPFYISALNKLIIV